MQTRSSVVQAGEVRSARIESLRALAALAVLEGHAFGYANGWNPGYLYGTLFHRAILGGGSAVVVFFALSGYLLFLPFARQHYGSGASIDLRRYVLNRILRILPLYYVAIVLLLLVREHGGSFGQWWRFGLFAENFSTSTLFAHVDGSLWSVVVEVHFYALLPLFALALAWAARRRRGLAVIALLIVGAAALAFRYWALHRDPHAATLLRYSLPGTFVFFIPGMLAALLRLGWEERRPRLLSGQLGSPTAWLLAAIPFWVLHFDRYADWPAVVGSFLVVGAVVLPLRDARSVRALEWRPLAALGVASYSIYVWHMPLVKALSDATHWGYLPLLALGLTATCAVALASYHLIEAPFLRLRRGWARVPAIDKPGGDRVCASSVGTGHTAAVPGVDMNSQV